MIARQRMHLNPTLCDLAPQAKMIWRRREGRCSLWICCCLLTAWSGAGLEVVDAAWIRLRNIRMSKTLVHFCLAKDRSDLLEDKIRRDEMHLFGLLQNLFFLFFYAELIKVSGDGYMVTTYLFSDDFFIRVINFYLYFLRSCLRINKHAINDGK